MLKATIYLLGCFCFFISASKAQSDTIYFSKSWDTCLKANAHYTRVSKKTVDKISVVDYFQSGKVKSTGAYSVDSPDIKQGYFKEFSEEGFIESEGNYVNNKREGLWKEYKWNGRIWLEEEMRSGVNEGFLKTYFKSGGKKRIEQYKNGKFIEGKCFALNGADTSFYPFEQMPEYKGGEQELYRFVGKKVRYPKEATRAGAEGIVRVQFAVDIDGSIKEIKVKKPGNPYLDAEAMRVVALMEKWKPGKVEGNNVKVYYALPIKFGLQ